MPVQQPVLIDSMLVDNANGAITQFAALIASTVSDDSAAMPTAAGQACVGIAQEAVGTTVGSTNYPSTGHPIAVMVEGIANGVAAAAIARGAFVSIANAQGQLRTAQTGDYIVGQARGAATNAGDYFAVKLAIGTGAKA